jgi:hypothetical protein
MPTEKEATAELTPEHKKLLAKMDATIPRQGYGLPMGGKDPANAPEHRIKNAKFPDEDKQDW